MRCPGFTTDAIRPVSDEQHLRVTCEGTARAYHLVGSHPHAFCGCGNDANDCHPGRCCQDNDWGECANCGLPDPGPDPIPESDLTDPLFPITEEEDTP